MKVQLSYERNKYWIWTTKFESYEKIILQIMLLPRHAYDTTEFKNIFDNSPKFYKKLAERTKQVKLICETPTGKTKKKLILRFNTINYPKQLCKN